MQPADAAPVLEMTGVFRRWPGWPGNPVMTVGDATQLEAVIDVLSSDAARIRPGMRVALNNWGGPEIAHARVRTVEPAVFTKVSALGVEEQRVNVVVVLYPGNDVAEGVRARARPVAVR